MGPRTIHSIQPDYPTLQPVRPANHSWLLWKPNEPAGHSTPPHATDAGPWRLAVLVPVPLALLLSIWTSGLSNHFLWMCVGMVVGWGLMLEHGLVAIYFAAGWGVTLARFLASQLAARELHTQSAVLVGTTIAVMVWRRLGPHDDTVAG